MGPTATAAFYKIDLLAVLRIVVTNPSATKRRNSQAVMDVGRQILQLAVFFDLGGTLLRVEDDEIYFDEDGRVEPLPNVAEKLLTLRGTAVFVITNQSGLEKGTLTSQQVQSFIAQINEQCGNVIQDYWACPFQRSDYRKPNPGMILGLADKHFVDLQYSIFVGDSESDRRCAEAACIGSFVWAKEYFGWVEV